MKFSRIFLLILTCILYNSVSAQGRNECLDVDYHDKCYNATKSIFDDYVYLKSRPFSRDMQEMKFTLSLRKGNLYLFNVCEGEASKVSVKLYRANDEKTPLATNYNEIEKRYTRILSVYPNYSGKYLISVVFKKESPMCVVLVQGMIRRNIETYMNVKQDE